MKVGRQTSGWRVATFLFVLVPMAAVAGDVTVSSQVREIFVTSITKLPMGPRPQRQDDNCHNRIIEPTTAAGRYAQDRGWGVISEISVGRYELVSFGGEFIGGTSGTCAIQQGNVGVFEGTALKVILYTGKSSDQLIGQLRRKEDGEVRLWSGEYLRYPVADISLDDHSLVVEQLSADEPFCKGRVKVPNVYGMSIIEARERLGAAGWQPVAQESEEWGQQVELHKLGVTETVSCSGTGFAYCSYEYQRPDASLTLTTAGELYEQSVPGVAFYDVSCAER